MPDWKRAKRRRQPLTTSCAFIRDITSSTSFVPFPKSGHAALDADTILSPGSGEAALRAAGAVAAAVDAVMAGEAANAFCAVRPPGHHAEPDGVDGFLPVQQCRHRRGAGAPARMASPGSRWSISTCITATARRPPSPPTAVCSMPRPIRCPFYPGTGAAERGRGRQYRQRAAAGRCGRARSSAPASRHDSPGACRISARICFNISRF